MEESEKLEKGISFRVTLKQFEAIEELGGKEGPNPYARKVVLDKLKGLSRSEIEDELVSLRGELEALREEFEERTRTDFSEIKHNLDALRKDLATVAVGIIMSRGVSHEVEDIQDWARRNLRYEPEKP